MKKKELISYIHLIINAETPEIQSKEINKLYKIVKNCKVTICCENCKSYGKENYIPICVNCVNYLFFESK